MSSQGSCVVALCSIWRAIRWLVRAHGGCYVGLAILVIATPAIAEVFAHPAEPAQLLQGILATPAKTLRTAQVVRGEFVYRKYLNELPKPLESSGEYLFVKNLGIVWHTQRPFESEFVITPQGMLQREGAHLQPLIGATEQAGVRVAANILLSVLTLDVQTLQSHFDLYGEQDASHWQLGLRPLATAVATLFREAIVRGATEVETVSLQDVNGDHTAIIFKHSQYSQSPATAEDQQRFQP